MRMIPWALIGTNFTLAAVNGWIIYRNLQLRKREREALYLTLDEQMRKFAPAIGFCVLIRNMPGVPEPLRELAAESIPDCVEVFCSTMSPAGSKIH